jgi:DNA-directed RNA polymerase subunit M/transcription elongation factor TFIIS
VCCGKAGKASRVFCREIPQLHRPGAHQGRTGINSQESIKPMAKIAKTADRKKIMDTSKSTDCPKCGKPTRIVKRVKDRERGVPGGVFISCSACEFYEKL